MSAPVILRVAVPVPLQRLFDYLLPSDWQGDLPVVGVRVRVPFGRGVSSGVLMQIDNRSEVDLKRLKPVREILDFEPLFDTEDLAFLAWAARYYQYPVGEVVSSALPVRLRNGEVALSSRPSGWCLTPEGRAVDEERLKRAPRQKALLNYFESQSGCRQLDEIVTACGECRQILKVLMDKGWITQCEIELLQAPCEQAQNPAGPRLNQEQAEAIGVVAKELEQFGVYLLDGVTGSGKTEVYLNLIQEVLRRGRQILILVPEIGLTPQLLRRFTRRIPTPTVTLHSGLAKGEREKAWHAARLGHARVILGTRSALFTPLQALGLVIVDEEHDLSFKQQDGFRYSARDLAVVRGMRNQCPVVLGSATPSLESLGNVLKGRYRRLHLSKRAGGAALPRMDLLDIRSARLEAGVSPALLHLMRDEIAAGNQVLLFLNRRGFAPVIICHDCGWLATCHRCDARMTLHRQQGILWCHHCGSRRPIECQCPECGGEDLRYVGQGTERLESTLQESLPGVSMVRIDRDSTQRRGALEQRLEAIARGEYSLLIGTQMLAKGHHFPRVTLVALLDVDQGLFGVDYRAAERMAQQIIQVAGRAGRADKPGRVVIQTRHPEHALLRKLVSAGYGAFAEEALAERQEVGYPPFSHQALLRAEAHQEQAPRQFLEQALQLIGTQGRVEAWGPVPAPMERRAGRYRAHLLVQAVERSELQQLLNSWVPALSELPASRKVRWSLDVDPQEMY